MMSSGRTLKFTKINHGFIQINKYKTRLLYLNHDNHKLTMVLLATLTSLTMVFVVKRLNKL